MSKTVACEGNKLRVIYSTSAAQPEHFPQGHSGKNTQKQT